jgi:hypothetical protein
VRNIFIQMAGVSTESGWLKASLAMAEVENVVRKLQLPQHRRYRLLPPKPIIIISMVRVDVLHITDPALPKFSFSLDHLPPRCIHRRALAKMERSLNRDLDRLDWRAFVLSLNCLVSPHFDAILISVIALLILEMVLQVCDYSSSSED